MDALASIVAGAGAGTAIASAGRSARRPERASMVNCNEWIARAGRGMERGTENRQKDGWCISYTSLEYL